MISGVQLPAGNSGTSRVPIIVDGKLQGVVATALEAAGGNKTEAANLLGIGRTTLWQKMKAIQKNN
ncbi:MAG: helix-turn-helix domain-containing protein [Bacillota bacterium]